MSAMPLGTSFVSHALEMTHSFFQGAAFQSQWWQEQHSLVCSSEAAARILSTLPVFNMCDEEKEQDDEN